MCEQDLLEDPAIMSAIDEETEFNALVVCHTITTLVLICLMKLPNHFFGFYSHFLQEEEAALLESLLGER